MDYKQWFEEQANRHKDLITKLRQKNFTDEQIITYFEFNNMVVNEPDFCLLYQEKKKCHDIAYLSCFLCACPNFRFNDDGLDVTKAGNQRLSLCSINSSKSDVFVYDKKEHLDCSKCTVPHTKTYVTKHFDEDWKRIMKECHVRF